RWTRSSDRPAQRPRPRRPLDTPRYADQAVVIAQLQITVAIDHVMVARAGKRLALEPPRAPGLRLDKLFPEAFAIRRGGRLQPPRSAVPIDRVNRPLVRVLQPSANDFAGSGRERPCQQRGFLVGRQAMDLDRGLGIAVGRRPGARSRIRVTEQG